ncbi:MAG: secretion protein HlyD family protein [Caulobacteraceae bacterium]|nr:secretion protein HlyD family protein [Caulobacteraceae bacterium]
MPDSGSTIIEDAPPVSTARPAASRPRAFRLPSRRWQLLGLLAALVVIGAIGAGLWWVLVASHEVSTDNAYVGADVAEVTPLVSGPVIRVLAAETQRVKAGQPLVLLDPADARIAVEQARAALGQAERQVRGMFANDSALAAQVAARQAAVAEADSQIVSARGDLQRAQTDLSRRQALSASGAVSGDELTNAQNRFSTAKASLVSAQAARAAALANRGAAQGSREVNTAQIAGADVEHNPDVLAAKARLDAVELALSRTVIPAPMSGVVTKKAVEVGQQVQPGAVVMQIVPTESVYVDANFKEVQLARVRPGQPVILTSDLYGDGVKFHGRVKGLSGGTGSAFSLIPAQNASGNWIKIVQRLPVRITLDPKDVEAHPLRVGLSMKATIDVAGDGR